MLLAFRKDIQPGRGVAASRWSSWAELGLLAAAIAGDAARLDDLATR